MVPSHSRIKLFENRWLEKLTVISIPGFLALWSVALPVIGWRAWLATAGAQGAPDMLAAGTACLAGVVLWTLTEYALHRFLFHWDPASAMMEQFVFVMHGNHHDMPNDPLRNLMPPIVSLPVAAVIWAVVVGLAGPVGNWLFLGWISGYVAYDLVHYACHQWPMKGRMARLLKTHHMRHHHLDEEGNYAITGMMWDRLFGTRIARERRA
ncbi:sterol desaturase family protein [Sandarakinorhabdus sp. AAP62]|uniref:sterol desaturase family protein n=1 Tax=Sandarakinorhabdus sp. AAP62 TaxID=1248916 RepID=UPI00031E1955|nr:sterol desaturase family protein [Sandarakinorhabdus sp. AAP62]